MSVDSLFIVRLVQEGKQKEFVSTVEGASKVKDNAAIGYSYIW
jgi:hypothetical protein